MFQSPSVSRGKRNKKSEADDQDSHETNKKNLQRAAKSQRKQGGLRRGNQYDAEDVGCMYGVQGSIEIASEKESSESETSESEIEQNMANRGTNISGTQREPENLTEQHSTKKGTTQSEAKQSETSFAPPLRSSSTEGPPEFCDATEEVEQIKKEIQAQLHSWAQDKNLKLDEKKQNVRKLLASWHPDKNPRQASKAQRIFQFIQDEVNRILTSSSDEAIKAAEAQERKAQAAAEKSAKVAALNAAKAKKGKLEVDQNKPNDVKKQSGKGAKSNSEKLVPNNEADEEDEDEEGEEEDTEEDEEWALVVAHGPASITHLRPWPRSHFSLTASPLESGAGEVLMFGGECYNGRELSFYSDLYRVNLHGASADRVVAWEKMSSATPGVAGPEARSAHQAVAWQKYLYILGGEWSSKDGRRFRQFNDIWRFDVSGPPGTRWEQIEPAMAVEADASKRHCKKSKKTQQQPPGQGPCPRSGHRMCVSPEGLVVIFGGFTENKKGDLEYLSDIHILDLEDCSWLPGAGNATRNRADRPIGRAGGLIWALEPGTNACVTYGGSRPRKGRDNGVDALEDLWTLDITSQRWKKLEVLGEGPGSRTGLCQCALCPQKRIVFAGVTDVRTSGELRRGGGSHPGEVSVFHNDVFILHCDGESAQWTQLWSPFPTGSISTAPQVLEKFDGGIDILALVKKNDSEGGKKTKLPKLPRGRISSGCTVIGNHLWIFGGACESGPKQEVTLDDLWRLELTPCEDGAGYQAGEWECIQPLSKRATIWFDDFTDSEDEDAPARGTSDALAHKDMDGQLANMGRKQKKEAEHKARMEAKREKQDEKNEVKNAKREQKKEKQRVAAAGKKYAQEAAQQWHIGKGLK